MNLVERLRDDLANGERHLFVCDFVGSDGTLACDCGAREDAQDRTELLSRLVALEEALRGLRAPYEATWTDDLRDVDPRIQTLLNAVRVAYDLCENTAFSPSPTKESSK